MRYRVNSPSIIHESLDGEAVILNLQEGVYYSLNETGNEIWKLITLGASIEEIAALFETEDLAMPTVIAAFLAELEQEKMIVPVEQETPFESINQEKKRFQTPQLHAYHDMKEPLLSEVCLLSVFESK